MVFRRCRAYISLAVSLLVAMGAVAGVGIATAGPASATVEVTICLTYSSSYCADVKDSVNSSPQPIWLYQASAAHDYKWLETQVECNESLCLCESESCVEFQDVQNPSLCLGVSSTLNSIVLIGCQLNYGGTGRAAWVYSGDYLTNWALGQANGGDLAVNSPLYSGAPLYPEFYAAPGGSVWERWNIS
jgi:hypothetical protein